MGAALCAVTPETSSIPLAQLETENDSAFNHLRHFLFLISRQEKNNYFQQFSNLFTVTTYA
jgi:hypothetical protein